MPKKFGKEYFEKIIRDFLKKDLSMLPGSKSGDRCIWNTIEIGEGNFKNGFSSEIFCKGKWLTCLDDFNFLFLKNKTGKQTSSDFVRITLMEFGIEFQREFQLNQKGIIPVSKFRIIKYINEENAGPKARLSKKGIEKIRSSG